MTESTVPPFSGLASRESGIQYREAMAADAALAAATTALGPEPPIDVVRALIDEHLMLPGLARLRAAFDVTIESREIAGVRTDVIRPAAGIAPENADRVLLNLHGGGLSVAAGPGGQEESIPIAALGGIEVVSVDYRMHPEHGFPAASEDLAAVYRALLERSAPESIGIYGCSSGGYLTAASIPWFESVGLPRPGAIGVFSAPIERTGPPRWSDSAYAEGFLRGAPVTPLVPDESVVVRNPYFGPDVDFADPRVDPFSHRDVLARFPPTLLIAGTRDGLLSSTVHIHAALVAAGVDARLHVWEGAHHCSFAQGRIHPDTPENRETWDVIVRFFAERLGRRPS